MKPSFPYIYENNLSKEIAIFYLYVKNLLQRLYYLAIFIFNAFNIFNCNKMELYMEIISPIKNNEIFQTNRININRSLNKNGLNVNQIQKNTLEEAIGRSQVNFKGVTEHLYKMTNQDLKFIEIVSKIFKLNSVERKYIEDFTSKFLREEKLKSLYSMKGNDPFEYANEIAYYSENISKRFDLSDYEMLDFDWLLALHIHTGDISKFRNKNGESVLETHKYATDYTPFASVLEKYGIEDNATNVIFDFFGNIARFKNKDSLFDLFQKENFQLVYGNLKTLLKKHSGESNDKANNIIVDLYSMSAKGRKERLDGINTHAIKESIEDGVTTIVIAKSISDKFGIDITKELLEMLEMRQTNTQLHKNGKSLQEIGYRIADKYNLPKGADKNIIDIINKYDSQPDTPEKINTLVESLKKY